MPEVTIKADLNAEGARNKARGLLADLQKDVADFKSRQKADGGLLELERENKVKGNIGGLVNKLASATSAGEAGLAVFTSLTELFKTGLGVGIAAVLTGKFAQQLLAANAEVRKMGETLSKLATMPEGSIEELQKKLQAVSTAAEETAAKPTPYWQKLAVVMGHVGEKLGLQKGMLADIAESQIKARKRTQEALEAERVYLTQRIALAQAEKALEEVRSRNAAAAEARLTTDQQVEIVARRTEAARVAALTTTKGTVEQIRAQAEYEKLVGQLAALTAKQKDEQARSTERAAAAAERNAVEARQEAEAAERAAEALERQREAAEAQLRAEDDALRQAQERVSVLRAELAGEDELAASARVRLDFEERIRDAREKGDNQTAAMLEQEMKLTLELRQQQKVRQRDEEMRRNQARLQGTLGEIGERIRGASTRRRGGFFQRGDDGALTATEGTQQARDIRELARDRRTRAERARDELTQRQAQKLADVKGWTESDVQKAIDLLDKINQKSGTTPLKRG